MRLSDLNAGDKPPLQLSSELYCICIMCIFVFIYLFCISYIFVLHIVHICFAYCIYCCIIVLHPRNEVQPLYSSRLHLYYMPCCHLYLWVLDQSCKSCCCWCYCCCLSQQIPWSDQSCQKIIVVVVVVVVVIIAAKVVVVVATAATYRNRSLIRSELPKSEKQLKQTCAD